MSKLKDFIRAERSWISSFKFQIVLSSHLLRFFEMVRITLLVSISLNKLQSFKLQTMENTEGVNLKKLSEQIKMYD